MAKQYSLGVKGLETFGSVDSSSVSSKSFDTILGGSALLHGFAGLANAWNQGESAKLQAEFERKQYETNARLAEMNAEDAIKRGDKAASQAKRAGQLLLGKQRTGYAGQGVKVDAGSASDIQGETQSLSELDQLQIKSNAWREAWGYKVEANTNTGRAGMATAAGQNIANNTLLTGGLSFLRDSVQAANYFRGGGDLTRRSSF